VYLLIRLLKTESPQWWIWIGVVLGLGLLNKISVLWLGLGIGVGLVATPQRRWLLTKWPWVAAGIAVLLFLPYALWNVANDYAHLEFIRNATGEKYSSLTRTAFIVSQILIQNPASVFIWLAGLWFFFRPASKFRMLGYIYVTAFVVLLVNGASKAEYLAPAYGMLFAGGAVFVEQFIQSRSWRWAKPILIGAPAIAGILLMPLVLAILPVETYISYSEALGVAPSTAENKRLDRLPQFYADMFGWEELTTSVLIVYESLPFEDTRCIVYTQNYGEAGAISFLGRPFGIPPTVSGHNSYYLWGPGENLDSNTVVLVVGGDIEDHLKGFEEVELVARSQSKYAMPYENNLPIFVCRRLRKPIEEIWPQTKHYE
jgi:4-amino-4-deoxy-L-arabinose transferase-like glycosyltransferase